MKRKLIVIIKGGLGNQLFCYAAAKRLAIKSNAELVIDNVSGFKRDFTYQREYALDAFKIEDRIATRCERKEPFGRYRRKLSKLINRLLPYSLKTYIEQRFDAFDEDLLYTKIYRKTYIDGYWQSELYFKDIENEIRKRLVLPIPQDSENIEIQREIDKTNSVCVHVRWFNAPKLNDIQKGNNLSSQYYFNAIELIRKNVQDPHFFVFSDFPNETKKLLKFNESEITIVSNNKGRDGAIKDLYLMTCCKHFVTANSTFSWWGAWLATYENKIVIAPANSFSKGDGLWGFDGLIPDRWIKIY